jgi:glycosyltransferase involved in cell wall biosynthesis
MIAGQNVVVVMPAYNAEKTIAKTWREGVEHGIVDLVIVVDDRSHDSTVDQARTLSNVIVHEHSENRGYGGNQKTCYRLALEHDADIVIMVHADYQYTPKLIPPMAGLVASNLYQCVLGSRILGGGALKGRMPWWRYVANRFLTAADNLLIGSKLSEFHTGYRAFSRDLSTSLPLEANSDDFVFDNQTLAQAIRMGFQIGEVSCPTRYAPENSSINFRRSVQYGFGCLETAILYRLRRWKVARSRLFPADLMNRAAAPAS